MSMNISGINDYEIINFRFYCSMLLPEFERIILGYSNVTLNSTFVNIMQDIMFGSYFNYYKDGDLTILKVVGSNEEIIVNDT